jgi:N-acetylmuramoyl-L-alanine amidase
MRRRTFLALLCFPWLMGGAHAAAGVPAATGARLGLHDTTTRFVLDVSEKVGHTIFLLGNPQRVVIDLPALDWKIPASVGTRGRGVVRGFRFGQFKAGTSRVVLDLRRDADIERVFLIEPQEGYRYRLVVDLKPVAAAGFGKALEKWRPPLPEQPKNLVLPPRKPTTPIGPKIIVVDPGHGGVDPGTIGITGVREKDITLTAGRELKKALEATGRYRVVLTRDSDTFLELRHRVQVARQENADLFISIHADSIADRKVRGATVYTLSERASDKEAAALADKENKADIIAGVNLSGESDEVTTILIDLAQRETMNLSARFAQALVPELATRRRIRSRPHRFAGFRVLKAPDVPSVLFEMGYLSNRRDERSLTDPKQRRELIQAIARAIGRYFNDHKS